jgi:hypothetical protein
MKNIIIMLTFSVTCLFSKCTCSSTGTEGNIIKNDNVLTLKFDFSEKLVNIFDIGLIYDVEILNLDCEEAIFGDVDKIIKYKNRIYILDKLKTYSVVIYDTLGNFVNLIERHGQGPNDYTQLSYIFIDTDDETLNLLSRSDRKILKHDLDGNIIKVEKSPKMFTRMLKTKDGYLGDMANDLWIQDKPYNLWTLSNTMKLKEGFFEINPTWNSKSIDRSVFSNYGDIVHYHLAMDFNIYSLKDEIFSIAYTFDFGKWAWPEKYKEFEKYENLLNNGDSRTRYILQFEHFQETENHIIAEIVHNYQMRLCVYNKQTGKTYIAMADTYVDKYIFPFGRIIGTDEKAIYTLIEAPYMKMFRDGKNEYVNFEEKYPEQVKRLREKFSHIDEEGNSFLAIYYIK